MGPIRGKFAGNGQVGRQVLRMGRLACLVFLANLTFWSASGSASAQSRAEFKSFLDGFAAKAVAGGVPRPVYQSVVAGLEPDARIAKFVAAQPEFTTPIWDYIARRVSDARIAQGRAAFSKNKALFARIGRQYGVDPYILAAIWGIETNYGTVLDNPKYIQPVLPSLATLAFLERGRVAKDEEAFVAAIKLVASGQWTRQTLVGSWGGAVGHTQVLVTWLLKYGQDGDGDGRVDPNRSLADALATTARFLKVLGYQGGYDWGYEVSVPENFDYLLADRGHFRPVSFFAQRGVRRVGGRMFTDPGREVFLYVPAGRSGPKFLMTRNYLVLKGYNFSDSYALAVAHLTDRIKGGGPFVGSWPRQVRFPDLAQRRQIQGWLKKLGYYQGRVEGRLGPVTQRALQKFQADRGAVADGFVDLSAYKMLQSAVGE